MDRSTGDAAGDAERERLRHEERKKAMEALIDAATDRGARAGEVAWSFGVGVGLPAGRGGQDGTTSIKGRSCAPGEVLIFVPRLSLPMGVAVDWEPKLASVSTSGAGWHLG